MKHRKKDFLFMSNLLNFKQTKFLMRRLLLNVNFQKIIIEKLINKNKLNM